MVISYDWHPHEHCSFVESANAGKVNLKETGPLELINVVAGSTWFHVISEANPSSSTLGRIQLCFTLKANFVVEAVEGLTLKPPW